MDEQQRQTPRARTRTRPRTDTKREAIRRYQPGEVMLRYCGLLARHVEATIVQMLMPRPDGAMPYLVDLHPPDGQTLWAGPPERMIVYHDELKPRGRTGRAAPATIPLAYWRDEHRY